MQRPLNKLPAAADSKPLAGRNTFLARAGWSLLSIIALIAVWEVLAEIVQHRHFPGPIIVFKTLVHEIETGSLLWHLGATLRRVALSFVIAMTIGSVLGVLLGRLKGADLFFDTWLVFFLNLPALVIIILCYIWLGLNETAAITAVVLNKIPNVAVTLREGARSLSKDLEEMAQVYKFGRWKTLRHVIIPQLAPFFAAAARTGLALVWKIVLVVELLGVGLYGVGQQIHIAFGFFDVATILAYAVAFIVVVQAIDLVLLQPLEAKANRWRR